MKSTLRAALPAGGRVLLLSLLCLLLPVRLPAMTVAELTALARHSTFEVVLPKVEPAQLTYEKPLPLELLSFTERNDRYWSIGTAFAIAPDVFVSNAHVLLSGVGSPMGKPHLRDAAGATFQIDRIVKFSLHEDFVVFQASGAKATTVMVPGTGPQIGAKVYAAGNALGEGVVLRDGLLTSLTPEDQDGRWKWLRFSAAASPGNSGGPLLDEEGRVLGVVTARSPGENLNYALPIDRVMQASGREGLVDVRNSFGVPILRQQMVTTHKASLPLPASWDQFTARILQLERDLHQQDQARMLQEHATHLPPGGRSAGLLATLDVTKSFALIGQQADDSWALIGPQGQEDTTLGDGETLTMGHFDMAAAFEWRDGNPDADATVRDAKHFMDGLLKGLKLPRVIGPQAIRITSLGEPVSEALHTDRFGRIWMQRIWSMGYADMQVITFSLPTPDGHVGLLRLAVASGEAATISSLRLMADYMHVAYRGNARQWKAFQADERLCPPFLRTLRFDAAEGVRLRIAGLDIDIPAVVLPLASQSRLSVFTGYGAQGERLVARLAGITVSQEPDEEDSSWMGIWAQPRPGDAAGRELQKRWQQMVAREGDFSGKPLPDSTYTWFWTRSAIGDPLGDLQYEVTLSLKEKGLLARQLVERSDKLKAGLTMTTENW